MYPKDYFCGDMPKPVAGSCFVLMPFSDVMRPVYDALAEALQSPDVGLLVSVPMNSSAAATSSRISLTE